MESWLSEIQKQTPRSVHDKISHELSDRLKDQNLIVRNQITTTRFWPDELIDKYLKPTATDINPHNNQQVMTLYSLDDVHKAEQSTDFRRDVINLVGHKLPDLDLKRQKQQLNKTCKARRLAHKRKKQTS